MSDPTPVPAPNPIRDTDEEARQIAQDFLRNSRHAALGVILSDGQPLVTRIAFGLDQEQQPVSLISGLSAHTKALQETPQCSLLLGEPGPRGDPLSHPRLSLMVRAEILSRDGADHDARAAHYLTHMPKAKLYLSLPDFRFVRFHVTKAALNGGFGKAYNLEPSDLGF